ncbi:tRNA dihydrouridine(20/20a) synthase DusA [Martelella alba]|uniref:tRNA-dihydrouridine(20/20a) synthase n=1 Tax=Martelella alba TaxID=2590451 RepID=A0A506UJ16_9HYPH|nr:tRNA dihydrouridine(20/20a) synthase DusA [Martelella alba]TPW33321.1 tRNA dihydrouridine(20/20a) synthase DusA [Martelella alba]
MNDQKDNKFNLSESRRFAVAPMIDWTDRHCRFFHRQLMRHGQVYTEMIVADAILHGRRAQLLRFDPVEHPVVLQLGGSDPEKLAEAARIGEAFGYDEINLNVGCPSDRVQSGTFGACLMLTPGVVETAVAAMKQAVNVPVTVKCRIGVDDQNPESVLPDFVERMVGAGADALWVHARMAWLKGLSPKENRTIPPLDYPLVYAMKERHPEIFIGINGGIADLQAAKQHLAHVDGVMLGRAAYQTPSVLGGVDAALFGDTSEALSDIMLRDRMMAYADRHLADGGRLGQVTRHMIGLFSGMDGARRYRQILSVEATRPEATSTVIAEAFDAVLSAEARV